MVSLEMGPVVFDLSWGEEHGRGVSGARELLSCQINNTLVEKVSSLRYGPFLNPCDIILLYLTETQTG